MSKTGATTVSKTPITTNEIAYGTGTSITSNSSFIWAANGIGTNINAFRISGSNGGGLELQQSGVTRAYVYNFGVDLYIASASVSSNIILQDGAGKVGIGTAANPPTGVLHIKAGTTAATTAPQKYTAGALLTSIEALALEVNAQGKFQTNVALNRYAEGGIIADFITDVNNSGIGETDLYTYTTKASTLAANGEKIIFEISGTFNDTTATSQLKFYFGGTSIGDTGALTVSATGAWAARIIIIRTGSTTARSVVNLSTPGASTAVYTTETDLTGLTFTNTNIIKVTGTAGGVSGGNNDITAKLGTIFWWGAANN